LGALARALTALTGRPEPVPPQLLRRYPELAAIRLRRGGLAPRIGGWALGQSTVAAITLWRTVHLASRTPVEAELLLHEARHLHHFQASATFPIRYVWESLRRGYHGNRFEADARDWAAARVREERTEPRRDEV